MQVLDQGDPSIFSVQLKLHAGITYSHAASTACFPPDLQVISSELPMFLKFSLSSGTVDWRYPFDLCSGVYRLADLQHLLRGCERISNPNTLELLGNQSFWNSSLCVKYKCCACVDRPISLVVTVNRVQDTFQVPIYAPQAMHSLDQLNNLMTLPDIPGMDLERYRSHLFNSVHVGQLWLTATDPSHTDGGASSAEVTVLIPAYNAEKFIDECIMSLLDADQGCAFCILVVDDGSTDGTSSKLSALSTAAMAKTIPMKILILEHVGLAKALDAGLQATETAFVARLDADDICMPGRLGKQLAFLKANPSVHVVGGQAVLLKDSDSGSVSITRMKTHPVMVLHSLFLQCPLLHPSVMFRKDTVLAAGGYAAGAHSRYVEDYDLWARIASRHPYGLANLPDALIKLRIHEHSKSRIEREESTHAAHVVRSQLVGQVEGREDMGRMLEVITHPRTRLTSVDMVNNVLQAFDAFQSAFLAVHLQRCTDDDEEEAEMLRKCLEELQHRRIREILSAAQEEWGEAVQQELDEKYRQHAAGLGSSALRSHLIKQLF